MASTQALLNAGEDVSVRCHGGRSALDCAVVAGENVDVARVIIENGADVKDAGADGGAVSKVA